MHVRSLSYCMKIYSISMIGSCKNYTSATIGSIKKWLTVLSLCEVLEPFLTNFSNNRIQILALYADLQTIFYHSLKSQKGLPKRVETIFVRGKEILFSRYNYSDRFHFVVIIFWQNAFGLS